MVWIGAVLAEQAGVGLQSPVNNALAVGGGQHCGDLRGDVAHTLSTDRSPISSPNQRPSRRSGSQGVRSTPHTNHQCPMSESLIC